MRPQDTTFNQNLAYTILSWPEDHIKDLLELWRLQVRWSRLDAPEAVPHTNTPAVGVTYAAVDCLLSVAVSLFHVTVFLCYCLSLYVTVCCMLLFAVVPGMLLSVAVGWCLLVNVDICCCLLLLVECCIYVAVCCCVLPSVVVC